MRSYLGVVLAGFALTLFAGEASATFVQLGKISEASLLGTCNKVGGTFTNSGSTHTGQSYGCTKKNCDGKGGDCEVSCDSKSNECYGSTPARTVPPQHRHALGILTFAPGKASGPPDAGPLVPTSPGSPSGPSGIGTPKPTAPPGGKLY